MKDLKDVDLERSYLKAKASFLNCIRDQENKFLLEELGVPLDEVILEEASVTIRFFKNDVYDFTVKTNIVLLTQDGKRLGSYFSVENNEWEIIEDGLVID